VYTQGVAGAGIGYSFCLYINKIFSFFGNVLNVPFGFPLVFLKIKSDYQLKPKGVLGNFA
tara:strand:- start:2418 stop:2597 length:180 start_codon:yes stop_codon:yes gene_type:complete